MRLNERGYDADMRARATIRGVIVNTRHVSLTVDAVDLNNRLSCTYTGTRPNRFNTR